MAFENRQSFRSNSKLQKRPPEVFYKKGVNKNFAQFTGKHLYQSLFFNKEAVAQVFSCEFCKIFKNTFFTEHPRATASEVIRNYAD